MHNHVERKYPIDNVTIEIIFLCSIIMRAKKTAVKILCDSGFSIYDIRSRKFHGTREKKREKLIWGED